MTDSSNQSINNSLPSVLVRVLERHASASDPDVYPLSLQRFLDSHFSFLKCPFAGDNSARTGLLNYTTWCGHLCRKRTLFHPTGRTNTGHLQEGKESSNERGCGHLERRRDERERLRAREGRHPPLGYRLLSYHHHHRHDRSEGRVRLEAWLSKQGRLGSGVQECKAKGDEGGRSQGGE